MAVLNFVVLKVLEFLIFFLIMPLVVSSLLTNTWPLSGYKPRFGFLECERQKKQGKEALSPQGGRAMGSAVLGACVGIMVVLCKRSQKAAGADKKDRHALDERQIGKGLGDLVTSQKRRETAEESCTHCAVALV
jgi:hypothetical protein